MIKIDRRRIYHGYAASVTDGDDVMVRVDEPDWPEFHRTILPARLWGIDAPERGQPYAETARAELQRLCASGFHMEVVTRDYYQRYICILRLHSDNSAARKRDTINRQMVLSGLAYWYRRYAEGESIGLRAAELEAKQAQRGVWTQSGGGMRPWDYRADRSASDQSAQIGSPNPQQRGRQQASASSDEVFELLERLRGLEQHLRKLQETDELLLGWLQDSNHQNRQDDFRRLREELQAQHLRALQHTREQIEQQQAAALNELNSSIHRGQRTVIDELRAQLIAQSDVRLAHAAAPPALSLWAKLRRALRLSS